jgi:hypothetical protein
MRNDLHDLYSSYNIIKILKYGGWARNVVQIGEKRNAYKNFDQKEMDN